MSSTGWREKDDRTIAEMRAWRRAQRGEDLTAEPPAEDWRGDWGGDPTASFLPTETTEVRDPAVFGGDGGRPAAGGADATELLVVGVPRPQAEAVAAVDEGVGSEAFGDEHYSATGLRVRCSRCAS